MARSKETLVDKIIRDNIRTKGVLIAEDQTEDFSMLLPTLDITIAETILSTKIVKKWLNEKLIIADIPRPFPLFLIQLCSHGGVSRNRVRMDRIRWYEETEVLSVENFTVQRLGTVFEYHEWISDLLETTDRIDNLAITNHEEQTKYKKYRKYTQRLMSSLTKIDEYE